MNAPRPEPQALDPDRDTWPTDSSPAQRKQPAAGSRAADRPSGHGGLTLRDEDLGLEPDDDERWERAVADTELAPLDALPPAGGRGGARATDDWGHLHTDDLDGWGSPPPARHAGREGLSGGHSAAGLPMLADFDLDGQPDAAPVSAHVLATATATPTAPERRGDTAVHPAFTAASDPTAIAQTAATATAAAATAAVRSNAAPSARSATTTGRPPAAHPPAARSAAPTAPGPGSTPRRAAAPASGAGERAAAAPAAVTPAVVTPARTTASVSPASPAEVAGGAVLLGRAFGSPTSERGDADAAVPGDTGRGADTTHPEGTSGQAPTSPEASRRARWPRVRALFDALVDCPPAEREQMLERLVQTPSASADARAVADEVRGLLANHDAQKGQDGHTQASGFLQTPAPERLAPGRPDRTNERLGPWRLVAPLGQGGMAEVWSARRDDGAYDADVAVKLMGHRLTDGEWLERFQAEQQALARLDHPNIARLLDAGRAEDGTPYFVMEAVQGRRIDEACVGLPLERRLALFLQLCDAVQFAHQRLLVHRDLKPQNVLVTEGGQVKLLDFGIAADLNTPEPDAAPVPTTGQGAAASAGDTRTPSATQRQRLAAGSAFTPWCASPEQIRGERLGTATDVYSLGVLLHLLLTGTRPYGNKADTLDRLMDAVLDETPVAPSRAAPPSDPKRAVPARRLRGDLDAIVARAMAKPVDQRYASVAALADDLRAHLAGLPVKARTWTWGYRTSRFIGRHRAAVATGSVALVGLLALLGGLAWQVGQTENARQAAEARNAEVRAQANPLVFNYHDRIANLAGALPVREALLDDALRYLDGMASQAPADPGLARELAETYQRIAGLYGQTFSPSLERHREAASALDRAIALQPLYLTQPDVPVAALNAAIDMWMMRAQLMSRSGRVADALKALDRAQLLVQRALATAPTDPGVRSRQGTLLGRQAFALGTTASQANMGRVADAVARWRQAVPVFEALRAQAPNDPEWQHQLGWALSGSTAAALLDGDGNTAVAFARRTLALRQAATEARPDDTHLAYQVAIAQLNLASALQSTGDSQGAQEAWRAGHAHLVQTVVREPERQSAARDLLISRLTGARLAVAAGQLDAARPELRAVLADMPDGAALGDDFYLRRWRAEALLLLSRTLLSRAPGEALLQAEAAERLMQDAPPYPDNAPRRWMIAQALGEQALAMAALGRPDEAGTRANLSEQAWGQDRPGQFNERAALVRQTVNPGQG